MSGQQEDFDSFTPLLPKARKKGLGEADPVQLGFVGLEFATLSLTIVLLALGDLTASGAALLLGLSGVFILFVVRGAKIIDRISKVGPTGIELTGAVAGHIGSIPKQLQELRRAQDGARQLTEQQLWGYEMGASLVMYFYHQDLDAEDLSAKELKVYRELVLKIAEFALVESEHSYQKALYLASGLEALEDRTAAESYVLGEIYRHAWSYGKDPNLALLDKAIQYFEESTHDEPRRARAHYGLAWVYDAAGNHPKAIIEVDATLNTAGLDEELTNGANWNAACSLVSLDKLDLAMERLKKVTAKEDWEDIRVDPELKKLQDSSLATEFEELYEKRKAGSDA